MKAQSLFGSTVEYYEMQRVERHREYKRTLIGTATFLQFGSDNSEEGGTFSTAIIRLDDGSLKNIFVELIKFIDE